MPTKIPDQDIRASLPFSTVAGRGLDLVRKAYEAVLARGFAGVPTGIPKLDSNMGGLQTGLHVLAAEPGAGKTALALHIARHAATKHNLPVVYASFDELPARLALKVLAASAGLSMSDMAGRMEPAKLATVIAQYAPGLSTLSFVAADANLTAQELLDQLTDRLAYHEADIGLLVIDYLQPWAAALAVQQGAEFRMAVGAMALELRAIANHTGCPVLMVSAQNRAGQGTTNMTSLRESSDLEYGADSILLLTKDEKEQVGIGKYARTLTIAKNRFGLNGVQFPLLLEGRTQVITERAEPAYTSRDIYND